MVKRLRRLLAHAEAHKTATSVILQSYWKPFRWNHSHAVSIYTGRLEGINNLIKTVRRTGYGYPDDEYFFLKLFDRSRR